MCFFCGISQSWLKNLSDTWIWRLGCGGSVRQERSVLNFFPPDGSHCQTVSAPGYWFPNVRFGWPPPPRGPRTPRYKPGQKTLIACCGIIWDDDDNENWNKSLSTPRCSHRRLYVKIRAPSRNLIQSNGMWVKIADVWVNCTSILRAQVTPVSPAAASCTARVDIFGKRRSALRWKRRQQEMWSGDYKRLWGCWIIVSLSWLLLSKAATCKNTNISNRPPCI